MRKLIKEEIRKIKSESTQTNRIVGQIKTVVGTLMVGIASNGLVDNRPIIKMVCEVVGGAMLASAYHHATNYNK